LAACDFRQKIAFISGEAGQRRMGDRRTGAALGLLSEEIVQPGEMY